MYYVIGSGVDEKRAALYESIGATSVETYATWEAVEGKAQDEWDWSRYDKELDILTRHGLKWVPFFIAGPAYATPAWFRETPEHIPCRCLEHGTDSLIESKWNPHMPARIKRFLKAFADRYRDTGKIESMVLGVQGDYGESIYSVVGGWTFKIPGEYHCHPGFWCNDPYALADFRKYILKLYRQVERLNAAWGTHYTDLSEVDFPGYGDGLAEFRKVVEGGEPHARRRWLDFIDWYRKAMTDWSDWWMKETRKVFPDTDIYVCTGGDANPEHGSNFAEQSRMAAKHRAGLQITNEESNYTRSFTLTRWLASAGRHYGAYIGFQPVAAIDEIGMVVRIFNVTTSGANQLYDYPWNIAGSPERTENLLRHLKYLVDIPKPIVPVALWYPNVSVTLNWNEYPPAPAKDAAGKYEEDPFLHVNVLFGKMERMRRLSDVDFVDESMLHTGALDEHAVLVVVHGKVMETSDARRIARWVRSGGRLIVMGVPKFESVEATDEPEKILFGRSSQGRKLGKGSAVRVEGWDELASVLNKTLDELGLPVYDLKRDGVFAVQTGPNAFRFLNTTDEDVPVSIKIKDKTTSVTARAATITEAKASRES